MIAVEQGHEEVVRVILQQSKSDVHQAANDGVTTVFSLAKKNKDDKVLKLLHQVNGRPRPTLATAHRPPPTAHRRRPSSMTCATTTAGAHGPLPVPPADQSRV